MRYHRLDRQTGEFILTEFNNLNIPANLGTPDINGVERTVNVRLTRASGWHYTEDELTFIPAYSETRGVKSSFTISVVKTKGFTIKFKSRIFKGSIPLGAFLAACFPYATEETVRSMVMTNSKYLSKKFFSIPSQHKLFSEICERGSNVDPLYALERFKTLFTRQTHISKNLRLKSLLSLSHFKGCYLEKDTLVYDGVIQRGLALSERDIFRLEHSGLTSVNVVTQTGEAFTVPLLIQGYSDFSNLNSVLTFEEQQYVLQRETDLEGFVLKDKEYPAVMLPTTNTLQVYCLLLNRLIILKKIGLEIDMNSYQNQSLSTLQDEIDIFNSMDEALVDDKIKSSPSMLAGISSIQFDRNRVYRAISGEESSLVVLKNDENPFALLASSGNSKLAKPVKHLASEAIKVRDSSFGVEDSTDVFENKNIGKSTPLCVTTKVKDKQLVIPLYVVKEKQNTGEIVEVDSSALNSFVIGEYNCDLNEQYVLARVNGVTRYVNSEQITHLRVSPFSSTSVCRGTAVYLNHGDLKRSQMAAKTAEQARTILLPERAIIESGIESVALNMGSELGFKATVRDVILDYAQEQNIVLPNDFEAHRFRLLTLKRSPVNIVYKVESVNDPSVCGIFTLKNQKTLKDSCVWKDVVPSKGEFYEIDDLLWAHHNVLKNKGAVVGTEPLKYHSQGDPSFFDFGIGCGKNLKVMFGFYHTMTVDDASLISDRTVRDMSMDTPTMFTKEIRKQRDSGITFGFYNETPKKGFGANGLPLVGTFLYGGDIFVHRYQWSEEENDFLCDNLTLSYDETGEVASVIEDDERIRIVFYNVVHLKVGDKLGGRHGNKTTVARILPEALMPYDYETGEPIDLVLNPLSLCTRMNISQIPELHASARHNGGHKIEPLYANVFEKYIKEHSATRDVTMRRIVDGETGMLFPDEMYVGYMYILRSVHITEDKVLAIGDSQELDVGFLQPVGHGIKNQRGQSVGAMETDLLVSKGCYNIVDEIKGIMSSDVASYRKLMKDIKEHGPSFKITRKGSNFHQDHFVMASLSMYVYAWHNDGAQGDEFQLRFANDEIITRYRELPINNIQNAIVNSQLCGEMSYFRFFTEIVTPIAVEKFNCGKIVTIYKLVGTDFELCQLTSQVATDIINEILFVSKRYDEDLDLEMFYVSPHQSQTSTTGMSTLVQMLREYSTGMLRRIIESRINDKIESTGNFPDDLQSLLLMVDRVEETGGLEQFISTVMPVIPIKYRQSSKGSSVLHDLTRGYLNVASMCVEGAVSDSRDKQIYRRLKQTLLTSDGEYKSVFEFLFDKDANGRVRNSILKSRVKHSMRANLAPADYSHPDQLGIPLESAIFIYQPYVNYEVRKRFPQIDNLVKSDIELSELLASIIKLPLPKVAERTDYVISTRSEIDTLIRVIKKAANGRYVYYNRAPALHETSMRGAEVYVHNDTVLRLHTLLTADQNADYDGDQEPVCAVFSEGAIEDVKTKLLPSMQVQRSNDGASSLRINQDSLFGLYLATNAAAQKVGKVFGSVEQLRNSVMSGWTSLSDTVIVTHKAKVFRSTAGRILVNLIVNKLKQASPDEDGYFVPPIDKCFNGKTSNDEKIAIGEVCKLLAETLSSKEATARITELQEFGYRANHLTNTTLSMDDFKPILEIENSFEDFRKKLQAFGTMEDYGLLPDNWYFEVDQLLTKYLKDINVKERLGKSNAFYKMVDSGAKGSESQLNKMFGVVGFTKGNTEILPTPILSCYVRGLSQFQSEDLGYEQRMNALSTVLETSGPGESMRTGSFELGGLFIGQSTGKDCRYMHRIFYDVSGDENLNFIITDSSNKESSNPDLKSYTYKGKPITTIILKQLAKHPLRCVTLDGGYLLKFPTGVDPVFNEFAEGKFFAKDLKTLKYRSANTYTNASIKSFINCFEKCSGLPQDYAGLSIVSGKAVPVGSHVGIKSSTASSEPANQMVISKRNLVASDSAYNGLGTFKQAIQYGKLFRNNKANISILAPEDGVISVGKLDVGTLFTLTAESGFVYRWLIPVEQEDYRVIHVVDNDFVFQTQVLSSLKGDSPEARIHPTLSLTWDTVEIDGVVYKNTLPNPNHMVIQFARFTYFKFLVTLYKDSGISIDSAHLACYAFQQLRTGKVVRAFDASYKGKYFVNIADVIDKPTNALIYNFDLTNGKETIIATSGALSAYVYQDSMDVVKNSFLNGPIKEVGYTAKLLLGLNQQVPLAKVPLKYQPQATKDSESFQLYEVTTPLHINNVDIRNDEGEQDRDIGDQDSVDLAAFFAQLGVSDDAYDANPLDNEQDFFEQDEEEDPISFDDNLNRSTLFGN